MFLLAQDKAENGHEQNGDRLSGAGVLRGHDGPTGRRTHHLLQPPGDEGVKGTLTKSIEEAIIFTIHFE